MASTKVSTIMIGNLTTTARWVDHFVVQLATDVGMTNIISTKTSRALWDGSTYNLQRDAMIFDGLQFGVTYYLRAGVVAPVSGVATYSAVFSQVAGVNTAPNTVTYTGSYVTTVAGVAFEVVPANVPSDIDHYESTWTLDSSTPSASTIPNWKGTVAYASGTKFAFFAGGSKNQVMKVFIRAVNTSKQAQVWTLLGTFTIPADWSGDVTGTINGVAVTSIIDGFGVIVANVPGQAYGKNCCANPGFEVNKGNFATNVGVTTVGAHVVDSWDIYQNDGALLRALLQTTSPHSGSKCLLLTNQPSVSFPAGTTKTVGVNNTTQPCRAGDTYIVDAWMLFSQFAAFPASVSGSIFIRTNFIDSSGALLNGGSVAGPVIVANGGWTNYVGTPAVAPATAVTMCVTCYYQIINASGSPFNPGTTVYANMRYDDIVVVNLSNLDNDVLDGATYGKVKQTALSANQISLMLAGVLKNGNLPVALNGAMSYTATTTSITWDVTGVQILRIDNTITNIPNNTYPTTGLTNATTYKFYAFYDDLVPAVGFVTDATLGLGSPKDAFSNAGLTVAQYQFLVQQQNLASRIALSNGPMTAVASAGGFGGGGGDGSCIKSTTIVKERIRGEIPAHTVRVGDWLDGPDGWTEVMVAKPHWVDVYIRTTLQDGNSIVTTPAHPFEGMDENCEKIDVHAYRLNCMTQLFTRDGAAFVEGVQVIKDSLGEITILTCHPSPLFYAGETKSHIVTHNQRQQT